MDKETLKNDQIGFQLVRIGRLTRIFGTQSFTAGETIITPEQFWILNVLAKQNGIYQRQIGLNTLKDRPNITRLLKILDAKGLVTKKEDVNKRKIYKIFLTEKGREVHKQIEPIVLSTWETCINGIDDNEVEKFLTTLNKIKNNLEEAVTIQL